MADSYKIRIEGSGGDATAAEIRKVDDAAKHLGDTTKSVALGSFFGGVASGAATEAASFFKQQAVAAIDLADRLDDLSAKAGVLPSALQTIGNAASLSGGSIEGTAMALANLQKNAARAEGGSDGLAESFARLGVTAGELKTLSPDQVLMKIADSVAGATDRSRAYADVLAVAGRESGNLFATLEQGSGAIEAAGKKMGVFGDETVKALARAKDSMDQLRNRMTIGVGETIGWFDKATNSLANFMYGLSPEEVKRFEDAQAAAAAKTQDLANGLDDAAARAADAEANFAKLSAHVDKMNAGTDAAVAGLQVRAAKEQQAIERAEKLIALEDAKAAGDALTVSRLEDQIAIEDEIKRLKSAGLEDDETARRLAEELITKKRNSKEVAEENAKAAKDAADAAEREAAAREKMARQKAQQGVTAAEEALAAAQAGTSKVAIRKAQQGLDEAKQFEKLTGEGIGDEEARRRSRSYAADLAKTSRREAGIIGGPDGEATPMGDITGGGRFDRYGRPVAPKSEAPAAAAAQAMEAGGQKLGAGAQKVDASAGAINSAATALLAAANKLLGAATNFEARLSALEDRSGS